MGKSMTDLDLPALEDVLDISAQIIKDTSLDFTRYLLTSLLEAPRLTILKGARGVGKTTLLLQLAKKFRSQKNGIPQPGSYFFLVAINCITPSPTCTNWATPFCPGRGSSI
ncbi:MAG: hypothetical protein IPK46_11600 [Saprospiraceae bacterium]|nr:hypothetical protein [Saprospiraceae bacterium]